MMKKILIGAAVCTALVCANPAKADAKVVTVKAAAKEMVKVSDKAYKDKKTHTVKFTLKGICSKVWCVYNEAEELETIGIGDGYGCSIPMPKFEKWGTQSDKNGTYRFVKGNGTITYSVTFSGKNKGFRKRYYEHVCAEKIAKEIKSITKGKSQGMKAIIVMDWLNEHAHYKVKKSGLDYDVSAAALYKGKAHGVCQELASMWEQLAKAAGIKKCGRVSYDNHTWNWVEVDGKKYYLDFQGTPELSWEYDEWCNVDLNTKDEEMQCAIENYIDEQKYYGLPLAWKVSKEKYCLWSKKDYIRFGDVKDGNWKYSK